LLIDDIGNEKMTEFVHEALQVVIDHRYLHKKPTFITSNYSLKELYDLWTGKIGEVKAGQLVRRIKTFGAIELQGKNWGI
jgi:DNA replication protein DnaC